MCWVVVFASLVLLLTSLPYLVGYARQDETWAFTGFVLGVEDGNSYIAKMLRGASGDWTFRTPYTDVPQRGVLAFLPYYLLGKLAAPPGLHEQLVALYHLFRLLAGGMAIWVTYDFIAFFTPRLALRRFGLVLAVLGGGLGWMGLLLGEPAPFGSLPLELYSPESFGFLSIYALPHLALARSALLWGLLSYLRAVRDPAAPLIPSGLRVGGWWLVLALSQPITSVAFGAILAAHWAAMALDQALARRSGAERESLDWKRLARLVLISALLPGGFILYNLVAFATDPFLRAWTSQNIITSPHPLHYLLAYGLWVPLAVVGAKALLRERSREGLLLVAWLALFPFLAYAPTPVQRRLPEGVWVALVVLACAGLAVTQPAWLGFLRGRGKYALLALSLPGALLLISAGVSTASQAGLPSFRPRQEVAAIDYLRQHAGDGQVVLAAYGTSNALPAWSPQRVVIGHGPESIGLEALRPQVSAFFSASTQDEFRRRFLLEHQVSFVFWGIEERRLGDWNPATASYLRSEYRAGDYEIFRVTLPSNE